MTNAEVKTLIKSVVDKREYTDFKDHMNAIVDLFYDDESLYYDFPNLGKSSMWVRQHGGEVTFQTNLNETILYNKLLDTNILEVLVSEVELLERCLLESETFDVYDDQLLLTQTIQAYKNVVKNCLDKFKADKNIK